MPPDVWVYFAENALSPDLCGSSIWRDIGGFNEN